MRHLLILICLFFHGFIYGQLYCVNYTSQNGLPNDYVTTTNEDINGYIWIGTASGLVMFDGVNFIQKGWEGKGDIPKAIYVNEILFDSLNNVWVSTERNGIYHQDSKTQEWTNFSNDKSGNNFIPAQEIYDIELLNENLLFGCASCGLSFINTKTLIPNQLDHLKKSSIKKYGILSFNNALIIGTQSSLLYLADFNDNSALDTLLFKYPDLDIVDLHVSKENKIIISDYDTGLYEYKKSIKGLKDINPSKFGDKWKYKYISDDKDSEWLVLPNIGIANKNSLQTDWKLHVAQPYDQNSLPKAYYTNIFKDKTGIIWVSSSKGLSCIHPDYQGFKYISNDKNQKEYLLDAKFNSSSKKYVLSYASPEDRIKFFDIDFKHLSSLNHLPDDQRMASIFKLIPHKDGYLALGNLIYFVDPKKETISPFHLPNYPNHIAPRDAFIDKTDLWIYGTGNKIIQYSLTNNKVIQTISIPLLNEKPYPFYLINDMSDFGDFIAISAQSVFILISKLNGNQHFYNLKLNSNKLNKLKTHPKKTSTINQSIYLGNNKFYLVSKSEGLHKAQLDLSTMEITIENTITPDQLYSPVNIALDNSERVWIATDNGLGVASKDLKLSNKITSAHGLKNTKLVQGLSIVENKIILNGENGIIIGDPKILAKTNHLVQVNINEAKLSNINLLDTNLSSFDHQNNNLSINVSIPIYANRDAFSYSYRLLNHIDEWSTQDTKVNSIHYEKLPPGSYVFEIKSLVNDKEGAINSISFQINPPYWKTWWFLLISGALILIGLYLFYNSRIKAKLAHERMNTQLAELKNEAIRAQLNPHFIFNALNSIRSMILLDKKEESVEYLGHFSSMVRDVLSSSKEKNISLEKELEFNKKYIQIEQLRFSQKFTYNINIGPHIDISRIKVPAMILQPFIENAIWHGLLHKEGEAKLLIDISKSEDLLEIKIDDNGIGRIASHQLKSSITSKTRKGFGEILSSQRVQTLGSKAKILIEDKEKNGLSDGTLVTIKIPIVYE